MITKSSVEPSIHMQDLLEDPSLCKAIARSYADIERVLIQTCIDISSTENRDTIGPTILGLKHIQDVLFVFKSKGDLILKNESKETNATA